MQVQVSGPGLDREPFTPSHEAKPSKRLVNVLAHPTWSVKSLLPPIAPDPSSPPSEITPYTLRHLCALSALPPPSPNSPEESSLLSSLRTHLHFVRHIQTIDTHGVEPLRAIRDESDEYIKSRRGTVELADPEIKWILAQERSVGRWGRIVINGEGEERPQGPDGEGVEGDGEGVGVGERVKGRYEVRPRRQGQMEDLEGEREDDIVDEEVGGGSGDAVVEDGDEGGEAGLAGFIPMGEKGSGVEDGGVGDGVARSRRRRRPPPQRYYFVKTPARKTE